MSTDTVDPIARALGLVALAAVCDPIDANRHMRTALDLIETVDGLVFVNALVIVIATAMEPHIEHGDEPVTLDVEDPDGTLVSIDDVNEPNRTAWRAILAVLNGDEALPFLTSPTTTQEQAELVAALVQIFHAMVRTEAAAS